MSKQITKKLLKEIGENFGGYQYGGNVYDYENALYYIQNYNYGSDFIKEKFVDNKYWNRKDLRELVCKYKDLGYKMSADQLYYSAGIYGNNGQLHKIKVYDKDYKDILDVFYIYYC